MDTCDFRKKLFKLVAATPPDEAAITAVIYEAKTDIELLFTEQQLELLLKKYPNNWRFHILLGNIFQVHTQYHNSITHLQKALDLNPNSYQALNNCGVAFKKLNKASEAIKYFLKALEINIECEDALKNLAVHFYEVKEPEKALQFSSQLVRLKSNESNTMFLHGNILRDLKYFEQALFAYEEAIYLNPGKAKIFFNKGIVLQELGLYEMAIDSYDQAIFLDPNFSESHCNKGSTLRFLNYLEEAIPCFDRALKIDPRSVSALVDKGMTLMTLGKLEEGLPLYEYRWENESFKALKKDRNAPLWDGKTSLQSKRILIHAEQGFGDTIQFCRYAFNIISIGGTPILEVPPTLVSLLETLSPRCQVFPTGSITPKYDFHCPIMSLPLCFKTNLSNIPCPEPYLSADPKKVKLWKEKLEYTKKQKKIGIIWSGNPDHLNDANRSIELKQFLDFLPENLTYYSLQKDVQKQDRKILSTAKNIRHFSDSLNDFSDTAAYASNLDLIITVDTGLAHLCGALGIKTWIVLPLNADWRWFRCRDDTPWYQSVSLFRQIVFGKWEDPFQNLREQLHEFL